MNGHFVSLAQVRAMVTEMEAANDPDEYYDSLRSGMANGVSVLFCIVLWLMGCLKVAQLSMVHDMHRLSQCTPMRPLSFRQRIFARDAVTLGELETLLARAQVGVSLKAGFVADMEERE
ncbi:hypothetical protein Tco_0599033 [Tanacetum coccineum]